jgi:hypothetical protein
MSEFLAYDSAQPDRIPRDAQVVLYYADGRYEWTGAQLDLFPKARVRAITVLGDPECNIIDVESGDCTPLDVPQFLDARAGMRVDTGTVYCSRSTLPGVQAMAGDRAFNVWLATLDGSKPVTVAGRGRLVAVQFAGGPDAEYDTSVVWDRSWPRRR